MSYHILYTIRDGYHYWQYGYFKDHDWFFIKSLHFTDPTYDQITLASRWVGHMEGRKVADNKTQKDLF